MPVNSIPPPKPKLDGTSYAILGGIILFLVAARIGYAVVTYDDWKCAFANCVKVEIKK